MPLSEKFYDESNRPQDAFEQLLKQLDEAGTANAGADNTNPEENPAVNEGNIPPSEPKNEPKVEAEVGSTEQPEESAEENKEESTEEENAEKKVEIDEDTIKKNVVEYMKKYVPEIDNVDDIGEYFKQQEELMKQSEETISKFVNLLEANPLLINLIQDLNGGTPIYEAIRKIAGVKENEEIPDPSKDLKAYDEYVKRVMKMEKEAERRKQELEEEEKKRKEIDKKAKDIRQNFQEKHKLSDEELKKFLDYVHNTLYGDLEGESKESLLDKMWILYKYPEEVAKIAQQSEVKGKNEAIKNIREKSKKSDNIPRIETAPKPKEFADELDDLAKIIKTESRIFY